MAGKHPHLLVIKSRLALSRHGHRESRSAGSCDCPGGALPSLAPLTGVVLGGALAWGLFIMPADHRIGETVRIMVPNLPAATPTVNTYLLMAVASALGLWRGWGLPHLAAEAAARGGAGRRGGGAPCCCGAERRMLQPLSNGA
jgi:hypothetical protein